MIIIIMYKALVINLTNCNMKISVPSGLKKIVTN